MTEQGGVSYMDGILRISLMGLDRRARFLWRARIR